MKTKITVIDLVCVQEPNALGRQDDSRFEYEVPAGVEPVSYKTTAMDYWQPLERKGLEKVSMVVLKNLEGMSSFTVMPTPEELAGVMARVVEVRLDEGAVNRLEVVPGQSIRFRVKEISKLQFRSAKDLARMMVTLIPG